MSEQMLRRIQLIFQTEVKILKYPYPGLSYYSLKTPRPLMQSCTHNPNCFVGLESVDSMRIGRLPLKNNNNLRLVYLCVLIMAYQEPQLKLLRRIKNFAYDESNSLTCFPIESIPEEFHSQYQDRLFRKLFVEFFHLVGSRRSSNKVIKFIEQHPILDLAFTLLFKRLLVGYSPTVTAFSEKLNTVDIIAVIFNKFELNPNFVDRKLHIGQNRYLTEDNDFVYLTCHWQDDIDMDFTEEISDSQSDQETNTTGNPQSTSKFSMKDSNCDSTQTKMTIQEECNRWVTPHKDENGLMFQSTVIPRDQKISGLVKSPTGSETHTWKGVNKANLIIHQIEYKCGELNNKLRKLQSDAEIFNHSVKKSNEGVQGRVLKPLIFKQVLSETKSSDYDGPMRDRMQSETIYNSNGIVTSTLNGINNLSNFKIPKKVESSTLAQPIKPSFSSLQQIESTRLTCENIFNSQVEQSPILQRINSDRLSQSKYSQAETKAGSSTSLFLKENPKRIFVRKI